MDFNQYIAFLATQDATVENNLTIKKAIDGADRLAEKVKESNSLLESFPKLDEQFALSTSLCLKDFSQIAILEKSFTLADLEGLNAYLKKLNSKLAELDNSLTLKKVGLKVTKEHTSKAEELTKQVNNIWNSNKLEVANLSQKAISLIADIDKLVADIKNNLHERSEKRTKQIAIAGVLTILLAIIFANSVVFVSIISGILKAVTYIAGIAFIIWIWSLFKKT
jgi:hypothetical protein